jgi:GABA permease
MLFALRRHGWAPRWVADTNSLGVPWKAILRSRVVGYVAVIMSHVSPDKIFYFVINSAGAVALFVYAIIAGFQIRMRRKLEAESPERANFGCGLPVAQLAHPRGDAGRRGFDGVR